MNKVLHFIVPIIIASAVSQSVFAQWISVMDYGATGDSASGNDGPAIAAAIAAAPEGGCVVFPVPPLYYRVLDPIVITKSISLIGVGTSGSSPKIRQSGAYPVIKINPTVSNKAIVVENLVLFGGTIGLEINVTFSGTGPRYLSRFSRFSNLAIQACTDKGIQLNAGVIGSRFESIDIENAGNYGIYSAGDSFLNATTFINLRVTRSKVEAVHLEHTVDQSDQANIMFLNPIIEYNEGIGFSLNKVQVHLINPWFESNGYATGGADLDLTGGLITPAMVLMTGGEFSFSGAPQANRRVYFSSSNSKLIMTGVKSNTSQIIDANNKFSASAIAFYGMPISATPTVANYVGGSTTTISTSGDASLYWIRNVKGVSGSAVAAQNLRGSFTISDTATSKTIAFPTAEADSSYYLTVTPTSVTSTPNSYSNNIRSIQKSSTSFTVNLDASPGSGASRTFDWHLIR